ncbi:MAG: dihydrodipicolinate synthase family protein, partial [Pseudomonadota bacterium]
APAPVGDDPTALRAFFSQVGERAGIPIMLQNAPVPIGSGLSVDLILEVATAVPAIRYVKEETLPSGQRITRLIDNHPASIEGVFGGAGGRYIIDELNRGVAGTLPASELTEAHVAMVRAHDADHKAEAREIFNRILPLLNMQAIFRMRLTKAVLKARGIFTTEMVRDGSPELDTGDREELRILLDEVDDLLTVTPPAPKSVLVTA